MHLLINLQGFGRRADAPSTISACTYSSRKDFILPTRVPYETLKTSDFLRWKNLKKSFFISQNIFLKFEHLFQPKKLCKKNTPPIYGVFT
jgi:hypothetical protein